MRALELAVVGGRGQQRADDLKAQTCPSHARAARRRRWPWPSRAAPWTARSVDGPYADAKNTGSAIFCANDRVTNGYIAPLTNRDPSAAARRGDRRQPRRAASSTRAAAAPRESLEQRGRAARRALGRGHQTRRRSDEQRCRRERTAPPAAATGASSAAGPPSPVGPRSPSHRRSATALATITTAPTYTRRPRNRTDGGVARWRHPSRPQHRLKRRPNASAATAISPPRGLRG